MRSRRSFVPVFMCACAALLLAAGCWRMDSGGYELAEVDEPDYRRAKELVKQGRNQEALIEFERVLSKRGLNNAPETHMDMAILYQQHMRDPLSAIYHYQKYLQQAQNTPRQNVVEQRIEAAKREYVSTLPGRPSLDLAGAPAGYVETINRLREQNDRLRGELAAAQAAAGLAASNANPRASSGRAVASASPVVVASPDSPFMQDTPASAQSAQAAAQPQNIPASPPPAVSQPPRQQPAQTQQPAQPAARRYVVRQGDSLYAIARQHYGGSATNAQVEAIVNANRDQLESRNTPLRPGMQLRLP